MPEFIYQFLAGDRPELLTDPDAWQEEDERASDEHYQRLAQATEDGIVILAGRSLDGIGPSVVILEAEEIPQPEEEELVAPLKIPPIE